MIFKKIALILGLIALTISFAHGQIADIPSNPAGIWLAKCNSPKITFDPGYEVSLITIDTAEYGPGNFSSEFYYHVDYAKEGQIFDFDCAEEPQSWEEWGINQYFSFSYSGTYAGNKLVLDGDDGYSPQSDHYLKKEFIVLKPTYKFTNPNELTLTIGKTKYQYYRLLEGN